MNDEVLISLYLDGRLDGEDLRKFEQRLETEPTLHEAWETARKLQGLAEDLTFARGRFDADDVRVRLGARSSRPGLRRWGIAAAAVLALAVTHGGAYWVGSSRTEGAGKDAAPLSQRVEDVISETERIFERASLVDASAPYQQLNSELVGLREEIEASELPFRLENLSREGRSEPTRRRAAELVDGLVLLETAFEQHRDPGFLGVLVSRIGREALVGEPEVRFVPQSASNYMRVSPIGNGRYRVVVVSASEEGPLRYELEGTVEELRDRNVEIRVLGEE